MAQHNRPKILIQDNIRAIAATPQPSDLPLSTVTYNNSPGKSISARKPSINAKPPKAVDKNSPRKNKKKKKKK